MTPPKVKTGDYLGDLTDELKEYGSCSFVENLCRVVQKTMHFRYFAPSTGKRATKCKVKGITLNYENSKVVNFTTLRDMILENAPAVQVHNPRKIKTIVDFDLTFRAIINSMRVRLQDYLFISLSVLNSECVFIRFRLC